MILKALVTAAKVTVTAHRFLSAGAAIIYIAHGLYCFAQSRKRVSATGRVRVHSRPRKRKNASREQK